MFKSHKPAIIEVDFIQVLKYYCPTQLKVISCHNAQFLGDLVDQGFFSKFLMGGLKIFGPRWGRSRMGGIAKKIQLKPKLPT